MIGLEKRLLVTRRRPENGWWENQVQRNGDHFLIPSWRAAEGDRCRTRTMIQLTTNSEGMPWTTMVPVPDLDGTRSSSRRVTFWSHAQARRKGINKIQGPWKRSRLSGKQMHKLGLAQVEKQACSKMPTLSDRKQCAQEKIKKQNLKVSKSTDHQANSNFHY